MEFNVDNFFSKYGYNPATDSMAGTQTVQPSSFSVEGGAVYDFPINGKQQAGPLKPINMPNVPNTANGGIGLENIKNMLNFGGLGNIATLIGGLTNKNNDPGSGFIPPAAGTTTIPQSSQFAFLRRGV